MRALLLVTLVCGAALPLRADGVRDEVDWPAFLRQHDLVWEQLPAQWNEGAFSGNGLLGFVAHATLADNRFDFHLARSDVTDHRRAPDRATSLGTPGAGVFFDYPRLDIGRLALRPAGGIREGTMRLDLWNAEITGTILTDLGELRFRAATLRDRMAHVIEVVSTERFADGTPAGWTCEFLPGYPGSPRALTHPGQAAKAGYQPNPPPRLERRGDAQVSIHPLTAGGDFATAWMEQRSADRRTTRLIVSTANGAPHAGRATDAALAEVRSVAQLPSDSLFEAHRRAWHDFFQRSFLSIPDPQLESFYWIQLYKLGCALRPGGPALDVLGPFYRTTAWPGIWWNLNIQLSYWPVYASNHLDLGTSLVAIVDDRFASLFASFRGRSNLGDFAWLLHNYWWQFRFAGEWPALRSRWAPKADAVIADYRTRLTRNAAGQLELGPMGSPEYKGFTPFRHTSYNLALLRWLLQARLELAERAPDAASSITSDYRQLAGELAPFATDGNGLRIGLDQPLEESHRHFSHLLGLYPLFVLDPDDPADRELIARSVQHWHRLEGGRKLAGYSFTGGAALYAALGRGEDAHAMLRKFLESRHGISQLHANTFYTESGGRNPVIETPLSAASAAIDLLLQSWGGKIRLFPAVPGTWRDASFRDLRAVGGFVVSAARTGGRTAWVAIRSEHGEPCVVKVPDWDGALHAVATRTITLTPLGPGEYRLDLRAGETVLLSPADRPLDTAAVQALAHPADEANPYGVKLGGELPPGQSWPEPEPASTPPTP